MASEGSARQSAWMVADALWEPQSQLGLSTQHSGDVHCGHLTPADILGIKCYLSFFLIMTELGLSICLYENHRFFLFCEMSNHIFCPFFYLFGCFLPVVFIYVYII